ncbi:MAG TPA: hypothetical protein VJ463_02470 [Geothrix sp.]|nr:hypothetical protein [Geothrix sp.]
MLIAALLASLLQGAPDPLAGLTQHPAHPALAAKAPGNPEYGTQLNTASGRFIFTNLRYNPTYPSGAARLYRVTGPAGMGPYRLGVQLAFRPRFLREVNGEKLYQDMFFIIEKALEGGAAKDAGLDEDWSILKVDNQTFGWNMHALISYMTTRPAIEVEALKRKGWGAGTKKRTFQIQLRRVDAPPDPADGILVAESWEPIKPLLAARETWSGLLRLRSGLPRFTPVKIDLAGQAIWVVRGTRNAAPDQGEPASVPLEFWREDPAADPKQAYPWATWMEPEDGLVAGRAMALRGQWYRLSEVAVDGTGRLSKLSLKPWEADVKALLGGAGAARDLGPNPALAQREALEQLANEALVEWKTRTLPGLLASQELTPAEDLVIRIEKGLLNLDLEAKGVRTRLDAHARAEAERKAEAQLAAKERSAPASVAALTDSERLADLLDQRKAILMAILGSAKQALANLRR